MRAIYTIRMARWLNKRGFKPSKVETDSRDKLVFYFDESEQLEAAIKEYLMTSTLE